MHLLVGLGNPGPSYQTTRHNAGFLALEAVRQHYGLPNWKAQYKGFTSKGSIGPHSVLLLQPQTFMNLSGQSVQAAATFFKTPPGNIWVFHDELDIASGSLKYKLGGGDAGHNGLKSITGALGANYHRVRIGIGRPTPPLDAADYVLQSYTTPEIEALTTLLAKLVPALPDFLSQPQQTLAKLGNIKA